MNWLENFLCFPKNPYVFKILLDPENYFINF